MGFREGSFARVWSVEDKGNYSTARITVSKKDKNTSTYVQDFSDGYVRLVGQAHTAFQGVQVDDKKGVSIKISSCDVSNVYTSPNGKVSYTPHYTIFGLEFPDKNGNGNKTGNNAKSATDNGSDGFMNVPDGVDDELPFD